MKTIAAITIASILPVVLGSQEPRQSVQNERIEVKLSTDRSEYKPGEIIRVRVELKNVGDHPILVGRELSPIANWPFSIWLRLVDADGKYAQPVHGAYIDPPPSPDLSLRDGVLRWWTTLDPHCFYGKEIDFLLESMKPGHYELRGDYYSVGLVDRAGAVPEGAPKAKKTPAFAGKVEIRPLTIEVLQTE